MPPIPRKNLDGKKKIFRKALTIDFKLKLLDRIDNGVPPGTLARELNIPGSTMRAIVKHADKIKSQHNMPNVSRVSRLNVRTGVMATMETRLIAWIEDVKLNKRRIVTPTVVMNEAKRLFDELNLAEGGHETFTASKRWYDNFKTRALFNNVDITGKTELSEKEIARNFRNIFMQAVESKKYPSKLVFNFTVTIFYWNRFQSRLLNSESVVNSSNDRFALLIGGNAAGDFQLEPLVVYHTDIPLDARARYLYSKIPVIWRTNSEGRVTRDIVEDWYINHFCPFLKKYCDQNGLQKKALLLLNDNYNYLTTLKDANTDVDVDIMFIPNEIVQPLDLGAISIFKAYYYSDIIEQVCRITGGRDLQRMREWLNSYDALKSLYDISIAWNLVQRSDVINKVWRRLWPEAVIWSGSVEVDQNEIVGDIVEKIAASELENISKEEMEALLASQEQEELATQDCDDNFDNNSCTNQEVCSDDDYPPNIEINLQTQGQFDTENHEEKVLTSEVLDKALDQINSALDLLEKHDSDLSRVTSVRKTVTDGLSCYRLILNSRREKAKQSTIYDFFKKSTYQVPETNVGDNKTMLE